MFTRIVSSESCFESLFKQYEGEGWVAVDTEKSTIFPEHPVRYNSWSGKDYGSP